MVVLNADLVTREMNLANVLVRSSTLLKPLLSEQWNLCLQKKIYSGLLLLSIDYFHLRFVSDVDECSLRTTSCPGEHFSCLNTPGSFRCECEKGFVQQGEKCQLPSKGKFFEGRVQIHSSVIKMEKQKQCCLQYSFRLSIPLCLEF